VANPLLEGLRQHVELNLFKLRSGRNIAGMQRRLDLGASLVGTPRLLLGFHTHQFKLRLRALQTIEDRRKRLASGGVEDKR
jgi:hypothetical protein